MPDTLRYKVMEPVLLLGKDRFEQVDIRIRVKGGGQVSQIYGNTCPQLHTSLVSLTFNAFLITCSVCLAIRQAVAKALVAFYQKCEWK